MKKYLFIFITLTAMILTACSDKTGKTKEDILERSKAYTEISTQDKYLSYQSDIGKWLSPETEYRYDPNGDNTDGIKGSAVTSGDRIYIQLAKSDEMSTGAPLWTYVNAKTGEKHYICPDPLCNHSRDKDDESRGCPYVDFENLLIDPNDENKMYAYKTVYSSTAKCLMWKVYEIDQKSGTVTELYSILWEVENDSGKTEKTFIDLICIYNNRLYIRENHYYFIEADSSGEEERVNSEYIIEINLENHSVEASDVNPDTDMTSDVRLATDNLLFHINGSLLYSTDYHFNNRHDILTKNDEALFGDITYDENTNELYVLVYPNDLVNTFNTDTSEMQSNVYKLDKSGNLTSVNMPSELTLSIRLTRDYIYYTCYEPISYGIGARSGGEVIDASGNKIYRAKRDNPSEYELVFDGRGELNFVHDTYFITGDYIWMRFKRLVKRETGSYFRYEGAYMRYGITGGTLKWINID